MIKKNRHVGSDFDDFLREEGLLADAEAVAIKRVLSLQLARMMKQQRITKAEMARRVKSEPQRPRPAARSAECQGDAANAGAGGGGAGETVARGICGLKLVSSAAG